MKAALQTITNVAASKRKAADELKLGIADREAWLKAAKKELIAAAETEIADLEAIAAAGDA